jgi:hypothetical protein
MNSENSLQKKVIVSDIWDYYVGRMDSAVINVGTMKHGQQNGAFIYAENADTILQ